MGDEQGADAAHPSSRRRGRGHAYGRAALAECFATVSQPIARLFMFCPNLMRINNGLPRDVFGSRLTRASAALAAFAHALAQWLWELIQRPFASSQNRRE